MRSDKIQIFEKLTAFEQYKVLHFENDMLMKSIWIRNKTDVHWHTSWTQDAPWHGTLYKVLASVVTVPLCPWTWALELEHYSWKLRMTLYPTFCVNFCRYRNEWVNENSSSSSMSPLVNKDKSSPDEIIQSWYGNYCDHSLKANFGPD